MGHRTGKTIGDLELNPTKHIDDVLDITKQYHNLLQRAEGNETTAYTWDTSLLLADDKPYLIDELGSPIRFGDEAYSYDEFGFAENNSTQPFSFTGYQTDEVAGTLYAQAREYAPQIGRFTSEDIHWNPRNMIYGDNSENTTPNLLAISQSKNLYNYVVNNPLKYIDPTGYECEKENEFWDRFFDALIPNPNSVSDVSSLVWTGSGIIFLGVIAIAEWDAISAMRPNNIGIGTWSRQVNQQLTNLSTSRDLVGKVFTYGGWAILALDVTAGVMNDIDAGVDPNRISANAIAMTTVGVGSTGFGAAVGGLAGAGAGSLLTAMGAGAAAGSIKPIVGTIVGAAVAAGAHAFGMTLNLDEALYNYFTSLTSEQIDSKIQHMLTHYDRDMSQFGFDNRSGGALNAQDIYNGNWR